MLSLQVYLLGILLVGTWVFCQCASTKDDAAVALWAMIVYSFAWPITVSLELLVFGVRLLRRLAPKPRRFVLTPPTTREPEASDLEPRRLGLGSGAFRPRRGR